MNPFGQYKILSHYNAAKEILAGKIPIPRMVSFWPTTICNFNCSFCLYKRENKEEHIVADTESTLRMVDQLAAAGVRSLEFSGGGEPTLHPNFEEIAEQAYDRGLKLGLFTNGTRLHFDILQDFRYIRIGLDAADTKTHREIKRPGGSDGFKTVCRNIGSLLQERSEYKRPRIGLKFLLNRVNRRDVASMVHLAAGIGVDYAHFKAVHNGPDAMTNEEAVACETAIVTERNQHGTNVLGSVLPQTDSEKCFMSPIHTVIDPIGDVFVCCFLRDKEHTIGNAFERDIKDFWGKNNHRQILSRITANHCSQWDCRWRAFNAIMRDVVVDDSVDIDFI